MARGKVSRSCSQKCVKWKIQNGIHEKHIQLNRRNTGYGEPWEMDDRLIFQEPLEHLPHGQQIFLQIIIENFHQGRHMLSVTPCRTAHCLSISGRPLGSFVSPKSNANGSQEEAGEVFGCPREQRAPELLSQSGRQFMQQLWIPG